MQGLFISKWFKKNSHSNFTFNLTTTLLIVFLFLHKTNSSDSSTSHLESIKNNNDQPKILDFQQESSPEKNGADRKKRENLLDPLKGLQVNPDLSGLSPLESLDSELGTELNHGVRQKRKMQTIVRETETEFFDEMGNFTLMDKTKGIPGSYNETAGNNNSTNSTVANIRPKMRVKFKETETIYDGSDEEKAKKKKRKEKDLESGGSSTSDKKGKSASSRSSKSSRKSRRRNRKKLGRKSESSKSGEDDNELKEGDSKTPKERQEATDAIRKHKLEELLPKILENKVVLNYQEYEAPPSIGDEIEDNRDY